MTTDDREPKPEGPMHDRYRNLTRQLSEMNPKAFFYMDVWREIEQIKNQFGGYPPPWDK